MSDAVCDNKQSSDTIYDAVIHAAVQHSALSLFLDDHKQCASDKTAVNQPAPAKDLQVDVTVAAQPDQTVRPMEAQPINAGGTVFESITGNPVLSDKERNQAIDRLEKGISKLIPEADRQTMSSMIESLAKGDENAFGQALQKAGGDPEKVKNIALEINQAMERKGIGTKLYTTADGKVIVCDGVSSSVPSFDPATGKAEIKEIEHNPDGTILVKPGEVLNGDVHDAFSSIGDRVVSFTNYDDKFKARLKTFDSEFRYQPEGSAVTPYMSQASLYHPRHHQ